MTPEEFAYWLQGFFELAQPTSLDERQVKVIQDHLQLVFAKVTPDRPAVPATLPDPLRRYCSGPPLTMEGMRGVVVRGFDLESAFPQHPPGALRIC